MGAKEAYVSGFRNNLTFSSKYNVFGSLLNGQTALLHRHQRSVLCKNTGSTCFRAFLNKNANSLSKNTVSYPLPVRYVGSLQHVVLESFRNQLSLWRPLESTSTNSCCGDLFAENASTFFLERCQHEKWFAKVGWYLLTTIFFCQIFVKHVIKD